MPKSFETTKFTSYLTLRIVSKDGDYSCSMKLEGMNPPAETSTTEKRGINWEALKNKN